ncbi:hypothetical protein ABIB15_001293 [Marisediminicola sp. UYEF4]
MLASLQGSNQVGDDVIERSTLPPEVGTGVLRRHHRRVSRAGIDGRNMHAGSGQFAAKRFAELRKARFCCRVDRVERHSDERNPAGNIQEDAAACLTALPKGRKQGPGQHDRGGEI